MELSSLCCFYYDMLATEQTATVSPATGQPVTVDVLVKVALGASPSQCVPEVRAGNLVVLRNVTATVEAVLSSKLQAAA